MMRTTRAQFGRFTRGLLAAALMAATIGTLAAAPAGATAAPTLYVDATGTSGAPCTQAQPCSTISAAVAQAPAGGASILVGPGQFIESAGLSFGGGTFTITGIPGRTVVALAPVVGGCNPAAATDGITNTGAALTLVGLDIENFRYGVYATGGTTRVTASRVACNSTGVYAAATTNIDTTTIANNSNYGVYTYAGATTTVDSSTIVGNTSHGVWTDGTTVVTNSTITGNSGSGALVGATGSFSASSSTISGNSLDGIDNSAGTATLFGTIVADNAGGSCAAAVVDNGFNLDYLAGETDPCGLSSAFSDVVEANPNLGPLQDNGGSTQTEAIVPGSPAYHAVVATSCPPTDQRGVGRPQPAGASFCDIGAFEFSAAAGLRFANAPVTGPAAATATLGPLVIQQVDAVNNPVPAASATTINLTTAPNGGTFSLTPGGTPTTAVVIPPGATSASVFFGDIIAGTPAVSATASGLAGASQTETVTPGTGQHLVAGLNTTPQRTTVLKDFGVRLSVTAKDAHGSPVANLPVNFTAPASGPSGTFRNGLTIDKEVTNSAGVATATFLTANATAGTFAVIARGGANGVSGVSFTLTNLPSAPTQLVALPGTTPQSATVATAFATAPGVTVLDAHGNGVPGVAVTFTAPASGPSGTFTTGTTQTVTTDSTGVATASVFTANQLRGAYNVVASSGALKAVPFAFTNLPGAAATMVANTGTTPQSADINTTFAVPLGVTVRDSFGNPVPGVSVTFTAPASGPSGQFAGGASVVVPTNTNGVATAGPFTANGVSGSYNVTATASGPSSVQFALTNNAQADLAVTKTGPATAIPGTTATYVVTVTNNGPLPALQAVVTDTTPAGTTFVSLSQTAGPTFACTTPAPGSTGTISCALASFANGATASFTVKLHVNATVASGTIVAQTATVSSATTDPKPANNAATANTSVRCDYNLTGSQTTLTLSGAQTWCLTGATVAGSVIIRNGANVVVAGSTVQGAISASGGGLLSVCGSHVQSISVSSATGFVLIGDPGDDACGANTVTNGVSLLLNRAGLEVSSNTSIGGSVVLSSNSGVGPFPDDTRPEIEGNTIAGSLTCSSDTPPASNDGHPNTVSGSRSGECIGL